MLIEIVDKTKDVSFVVRIRDEYAKAFESKLPFVSRARIWKEEVYFETPLSIEGGVPVGRVRRNGVYFWVPGKALCLFFGSSQIYTPGIEVGYLVDPANRLQVVEEGDEILVDKHGPWAQLKDVVVALANEGFDVGTPLDQGARIVVARKSIGGVDVSLSIFVEEYGVHVESEALAKYRDDLIGVREFNRLKRLVESIAAYARLDVSEEGFVVLTACSEDRSKVVELAEDVVRATWLAKKHLAY